MSQDNEKTPEETPEPEAATPGAESLDSLRQQVQELKVELAASHDRYLRERAELENFKKRMQREKVEAVRFACEPLLRDLLPIVDNLERALGHGGSEGQSVIEGVQLVLKSLLEALARHGVKRVEAVGERFDPAVHQAIAHVDSDEQPANHVTEQHLIGYQLHDRLLRPAMVTVSRGKTDPAVESTQNSD